MFRSGSGGVRKGEGLVRVGEIIFHNEAFFRACKDVDLEIVRAMVDGAENAAGGSGRVCVRGRLTLSTAH